MSGRRAIAAWSTGPSALINAQLAARGAQKRRMCRCFDSEPGKDTSVSNRERERSHNSDREPTGKVKRPHAGKVAGLLISFSRPISYGERRYDLQESSGIVHVHAAGFIVGLPGAAQGNRGKAELKTGAGSITVDYGRPVLKGRDMLSQLKPGDFWRMGMNQATTLTTPVDLTFGGTKVRKGSYSLFLDQGCLRQVRTGVEFPDRAMGNRTQSGKGCRQDPAEEGSGPECGRRRSQSNSRRRPREALSS